MDVALYIKHQHPKIDLDDFKIDLSSTQVMKDIEKVIRSYADFLQDELAEVLNQAYIYNCSQDREGSVRIEKIDYQ